MSRLRGLLPLAPLLLLPLLVGCAAVRPVDVHFWPPDAPVLPLLTQPATEEEPERHLRRYVVLLPDEDGTVGAIDVTRDGVTVRLDEAYQTVDLDSLARPYAADTVEVHEIHSPAFDHEPAAPTRYVIYFETGSDKPTAESQADVDSMLESLADRPAPEIWITGHADRSGSAEWNRGVSRARANGIYGLLIAAGVDADAIQGVAWLGEDRPAVATEDGVREAANRRVEIRIR